MKLGASIESPKNMFSKITILDKDNGWTQHTDYETDITM